MATPRRPEPEPLETDDVRVVALGTVLWAVALAASVLLGGRLDEDGRGSWVWIAAAGFALGLIGLRHVLRRRAAARQQAAQGDPSAGRTGPNQG